jgi:hypothetical protein
MTRQQTTDSGAPEFPERWTAQRLADAMPGSTRKWMLTTMIPELVRAGVLVKRGRRWTGTRSAIVAALGNAA